MEARHWQLLCPSDISVDSLKCLFNHHFQLHDPVEQAQRVHTQVPKKNCTDNSMNKLLVFFNTVFSI